MGEYGPSIGRDVILTVIFCNGRCFCFRIDAPFLCQPASVEGITCYQTYGGDQYNNQRVHNKIPPRSKMIFPVYMDSKWKKKREKANCVGMLGNKKSLRLPDLCKKTKLYKKRYRVTTSNYRLFLWSITQTRSPMIHFPVNLFSANGERPVRTTFHFWFRLYSSQGIVLWDTCHLAPADGSL